MEIIAAFKKETCTCHKHHGLFEETYVVFFEPAFAGDNFNEAELVIHKSTFENYKIPTFHSRQEAYDYAFLHTFGDGWEDPEN